MNFCNVYYKEIPSTVSHKDCTFSFQKQFQSIISEEKDRFLKQCLNMHGVPDSYEIEIQSNGKPYLSSHPDLFFNLSHTASHQLSPVSAALVIGCSSSEIGIDAEYLRVVKPTLAKKICSQREYDAFVSAENKNEYLISLWTLKEAYLKYTGDGLRHDLTALDFQPKTCLSDYCIYTLDSHPEVTLYHYHLPNNLWVSVCTQTGANAPVLVQLPYAF